MHEDPGWLEGQGRAAPRPGGAIAMLTLTLMLILTGRAASVPAPAPLADVPFEEVSGLVCFEIAVPGRAPVRALLDTGFPETFFDVEAARRNGLTPRDVKSEAAPGGAVDVGTLAPTSLTIGALTVPDVALKTLPMEGLSAVIGRPLEAIVGHDLLERYVVEIDWSAHRVRFFDAARYVHTGPGLVLGIDIREGQPLLTAAIEMPGGRVVYGAFKMDTGSLDAAGLNLNFVRDQALLPGGTAELSMRGLAAGGETEGRLFRARGLWLGNRRFAAPLIGYTVDSKGFENRADAGTIGVAVLSQFRLILDYTRRRVIFEGGPAGDGRVAEDRSGAFVVAAPPDFHALVVAQVLVPSPASAVGLQAGDEIVSVDGRALPLGAVRQALQGSGPVRLQVQREGATREVVLRRAPLLP